MSVRLEYAPSARAGCKATECKKNGTKIAKGELRHCTFFTFGEDKQGWSYRHWGCVTPQQIGNINKAIEGNLDYLDGYEDLNENDQTKVRQAIADGHIADEDWRYDVEMNRPGKRGFRSPAAKAREKSEKKAAKDQDQERDCSESPSKSAPKQKRARAKMQAEGSGSDVDVKPKKKSRSASNVKDDPDEAVAEASTKRKPRTAPKAYKEDDNSEVNVDSASQRKLRGASRKVKRERTHETDAGPVEMSRNSEPAVTEIKEELAEHEIQSPSSSLPHKIAGRVSSNATVTTQVKPSTTDVDDGVFATEGGVMVPLATTAKKKKTTSKVPSGLLISANGKKNEDSDEPTEQAELRKFKVSRRKPSSSAEKKNVAMKDQGLKSAGRVTRSGRT